MPRDIMAGSVESTIQESLIELGLGFLHWHPRSQHEAALLPDQPPSNVSGKVTEDGSDV